MNSRRIGFRLVLGLAAMTAGLGCSETLDEATGGITVFNMRGTVRGFPSGSPISGVELCPTEIEGYDCATSDASGEFTISFPQNADSYLTATHPDYPRHLMHVQPLGGRPFEPVMLSQTQLDEAAEAGGGTVDSSKGHIFLVATDGSFGVNGIVGRTSTPGDLPAVYYDGFDEPDELLPSTTANGAVFLGNITPGVHTVFTDHNTLECFVPTRSRDGDGVPFLFEAGTVSVSDEWDCMEPAPGGEESSTGG